MNNKYDIHPDFHRLKLLKMPKSLLAHKVGNLFLRLFYRLQKVNSAVSSIRETLLTRDGDSLIIDIFTPKGDVVRPCLLYFPGGGFLMSATPFHKKVLANIAAELNVTCVMVHYRLAPKYAFPAALHDVIDALEHFNENAEAYNIDRSRIAVGGDSAGGNLAAGACLYNKDMLGYSIKCALLIYPATDRGQMSDSRHAYVDTPMFHSQMLEVVKKAYYPNGLFGLDKYAFPLFHDDVSGLPPTYVETAEFDPLHDDGILYYQKLRKAKVTAELNDTKGTVHGYDIIQKSEIVKESMRRRKNFLKRYL